MDNWNKVKSGATLLCKDEDSHLAQSASLGCEVKGREKAAAASSLKEDCEALLTRAPRASSNEGCVLPQITDHSKLLNNTKISSGLINHTGSKVPMGIEDIH